ncbi:UPF0014-domain-containing protein [Pleurotus eryngii]|uniref:UPF0014-domain-containing protein n=1 Tax=Pleurotus eryngii TaxID=5323 RepID=A0A9P5ZL20_PLEER|nr:UPF0014-domain-containing protein [Pleurotus eryngii]
MDTSHGQPEYSAEPNLSWVNVGLALSFILFDVALSSVLRLGIERPLITSSIRCVIQLGLASTLLQRVFNAKNPWAVAAIVCLLNVLGTFEVVVNKSKKRHPHMFISTLVGLALSNIPVSVLGSRFAMSNDPFWDPRQFIPIVGMLCGSTISGVVVSSSYILREFSDNSDKVEMYLTFGATRWEACKSMSVETLRVSLMPTINQMSVLGIISIPGMMTGALLGGASVERAAKLQMIIMFMISASNALGCILTTVMTLSILIDGDSRVRTDRIDSRPHAVWRIRSTLWLKVVTVARENIPWMATPKTVAPASYTLS